MSLYTMNTHAQYVNSDNTCHTKIEDEEKKKKKKKREFEDEVRIRAGNKAEEALLQYS